MSAVLGLSHQLVWDRLLAIVEEQAQVLMRTAFSPVVREAGDLSAGVFDTRGQMLAQAVTGTPGHVNAMAESVAKFLARRPTEQWQARDAWLTNDPWDGTGHLNDFTVLSPVVLGDRVVAFFASTSHIADVGGRGFGPDAADLFEEGLRIPIQPLFDAGELNQTLMALIQANVRDPVAAQGDLYSLVTCNERGGASLLALMRELGLEELDATGAEILGRSEQAMRALVRDLPDGLWHASMTTDGYDEPVVLACALEIKGDAITLDFAGSSGASTRGINVPLPYTRAYASFGLRCVIGGEIPNNAGSLSVIDVRAPAGSILAAEPPAAVSARHAVGQMLPDVVLGALGQVLPESVPAEGASTIWNPVFLGLGGDDAERFVINPIFNGGTGARPGKDGLATTAFPSGVRTTPTEINEATSPLVFWRKETRLGSGGAGRYRGGDGQIIEIAHRFDRAFAVSKMFDRCVYPARGRFGGEDGAVGEVALLHPDGRAESLPGKRRDVVPAGARLRLETPGGGGLGEEVR